ncbi:protein Wnt-2b-like [Eriocheir sinensis]|uniref:protein Wnt-2b-like n=1 Tax=Eriocheir sinensis TaxID=95602 RepID=UPI0021C9D4BB|nr:protein Wnt-2b-like [Eriocheir sinensis]XP_050707026.1 protein Wnt-2b-like [Eriocheir sinensis]XP_050707028.1 protein Wnt-2b-like [Eriocheir sinensis]XP_050707029.1 protein Wnt-2b-like [Eriocheir sinensis]XP_050707030.1 protein Wnt-2b-like [Eriocheir sinensis]XP_050707031.1 protein Wnt-2b-like [Eriocheir sinensis]
MLVQAEGTMTFRLLPASSSVHLRESKVRVHAYFHYDPKEDNKHIPCKEAGLPFNKLDILHIVTQDDPYWTVSSAGVLGAHLLCSRVPGLTPRQSRICTRAPDAMVAISEGARAGLRECQRQFQHHRWNCSLASTSSSAFGHIVLVGGAERDEDGVQVPRRFGLLHRQDLLEDPPALHLHREAPLPQV